MSEFIVNKISEFIRAADAIKATAEIPLWHGRVSTYIRQLFGSELGKEYLGVCGDSYSRDSVQKGIGFLEALAAKLQVGLPASGLQPVTAKTISMEPQFSPTIAKNKKVFIVHGRDAAAKETLARFIEKLDLDAIILHEQPNMGQTIIEKFEVFSDVGYAVVLLTPDDVGYPKGEEGKNKKRARQNVILELGYFIGKLGRKRVCALYSEGVEMPSDYQGVVYIQLDPAGAWKTKLAQELVQAGMNINLKGIL